MNRTLRSFATINDADLFVQISNSSLLFESSRFLGLKCQRKIHRDSRLDLERLPAGETVATLQGRLA